jgi:hypothetical protein
MNINGIGGGYGYDRYVPRPTFGGEKSSDEQERVRAETRALNVLSGKSETKILAALKIAEGMDADEAWLAAENIVKSDPPNFKDILKNKTGG